MPVSHPLHGFAIDQRVRVGQTSNGNALRTANIPNFLFNRIYSDYATSVALRLTIDLAQNWMN